MFRRATAVGLVALSSVSSFAEVAYTVTGVGPAGEQSYAYGLNDLGQVVGVCNSANSSTEAFLYSQGQITYLGTLGGARSWATAINDSGRVVGWSQNSDANGCAFLWDSTGMHALGVGGGSTGFSVAYAINGSGVVAGASNLGALYQPGPIPGSPTNGWVFDPQTGDETGLGYYSSLMAINNEGVAAGWGQGADGFPHAMILSGNSVQALGTFGGLASYAFGINSGGDVVGYSNLAGAAGPYHAFLYNDKAMQDLGTLGGPNSYAYAVNDQGDVVGVSDQMFGYASVPEPFVYNGRQMLDLNDLIDPASGWNLEQAQNINNRGQIVGWGVGPDGFQGFLLTPTCEPPAVPGPGGLPLMVGGVVLALKRRRRVVRGKAGASSDGGR